MSSVIVTNPPFKAEEDLFPDNFEATCHKTNRQWKNEIIEWPCILVSTETHQIVDEFRSMVRPTEQPTLTPFCTELTSIQQTDVDEAPTLEEVILDFD